MNNFFKLKNINKINFICVTIFFVVMGIYINKRQAGSFSIKGIIEEINLQSKYKKTNVSVKFDTKQVFEFKLSERLFFDPLKYINLKSGDSLKILLSNNDEVIGVNNLSNQHNFSNIFFSLESFGFFVNIFLYVLFIFNVIQIVRLKKYLSFRFNNGSTNTIIQKINTFSKRYSFTFLIIFAVLMFAIYLMSNFSKFIQPRFENFPFYKYFFQFTFEIMILYIMLRMFFLTKKYKKEIS